MFPALGYPSQSGEEAGDSASLSPWMASLHTHAEEARRRVGERIGEGLLCAIADPVWTPLTTLIGDRKSVV